MKNYEINSKNIPSDLEPDENITLWRYMSFSSLCDILINDCIPLISIRCFPDKSEGVILREILSKLPNVNINQIEYAMQKYRESVYVSSWHISDNENAAMWDRYTHGGEGVAIKTNAKLLLECIPQGTFIRNEEIWNVKPPEPKEGIFQSHTAIINRIKYIDKNPTDFEIRKEDFNKGYDKICFFYKFADFKDEKEVRILTSPFQDQYGYAMMEPEKFSEYSADDPNIFNDSVYKKIESANKLIQKILTSPHAHNYFICTVRQIINIINEHRETTQSELIQCDIDESRRKEWV